MRKKKKQTKKKPIYGYIILFLPLNTYIMNDDFFLHQSKSPLYFITFFSCYLVEIFQLYLLILPKKKKKLFFHQIDSI